jgi:hypothetical protein
LPPFEILLQPNGRCVIENHRISYLSTGGHWNDLLKPGNIGELEFTFYVYNNFGLCTERYGIIISIRIPIFTCPKIRMRIRKGGSSVRISIRHAEDIQDGTYELTTSLSTLSKESA